MVDVTGTTKGKGFQGVIKRHGTDEEDLWDMVHIIIEVQGSMGTMRPSNVVSKGKKLPGHMGTLTVTIQNLEIVMVDVENNCIL
ncbi:MAG: 50S ribosomal protein L3 [Bacilli bacterium]